MAELAAGISEHFVAATKVVDAPFGGRKIIVPGINGYSAQRARGSTHSWTFSYNERVSSSAGPQIIPVTKSVKIDRNAHPTPEAAEQHVRLLLASRVIVCRGSLDP